MFLLDTEHIGIIQRHSQPQYGRLTQRMGQHSLTAFYAPIVSFHEQALGANNYINRARAAAGVIRGYEMLQLVLTDYVAMQVLPFDQAASDTFALLRTQGVRIGTMDLRIAAIALARGLVVLTRNLGDFRRVPGLTAEDWTV
jgi:tRNA(fMet)-specific endonuclease VapC